MGFDPQSETGEFKIWDLKSGSLKQRQDSAVGHNPSAGFSHDGQTAFMIIGGGVHQVLGIVDVATGEWDNLAMPQPDDQVASAAFSPVTHMAAVGIVVMRPGGRKAIDLYDLRNRTLVNSFVPANYLNEWSFRGMERCWPVRCSALLSPGKPRTGQKSFRLRRRNIPTIGSPFRAMAGTSPR